VELCGEDDKGEAFRWLHEGSGVKKRRRLEEDHGQYITALTSDVRAVGDARLMLSSRGIISGTWEVCLGKDNK